MVRQRRRLTAEDWAEAALLAFAEGGLAAVAVEPIATRLGATKGSFYWHFPHRDALVVAALALWSDGPPRTGSSPWTANPTRSPGSGRCAPGRARAPAATPSR
ncbi:TetR/AcrR family transcriptional regulator [Longispora sp. K20-0274]|uniref:helix-turn-helix domain-containing protein n=1 Tax=Longispora sp. K20-0274 TaxID=3088255 RepID=UPI00399AB05B